MNQTRVALVTGATGGLGAGIAMRLAAAGADVAIHYHTNRDRAAALESDVAKLGRAAHTFQADLTTYAGARHLVSEVISAHGRLDMLINNAGVAFSRVPVADIDIERWRSLFAVNLDAPFHLCKEVLPGMRARGWGRIVNIGSNAVKLSSPGAAAYVTSKAALHAFTSVIAKEEGRHNILINTVAPGFANTEMGMRALAKRTPEDALLFRDAIPLRRFCEPEDVGNMVAFLCSEEAGFVTGQVFYVNGGDRIETFNLPEKLFAQPVTTAAAAAGTPTQT